MGAKVLDFALQGGVIFFDQGPVYKVSILFVLDQQEFVFGGDGSVVLPYRTGMKRAGVDSATTTIGGK